MRLKWYKRDPDAALMGMAALTLEECGAYNLLLDLIYSRNGELPDNDELIARTLRCHPRTWKKLKASLMRQGKIWIEGSKIGAKRVEETLSEARTYSERQSNAAKSRWKSKGDASLARANNHNHIVSLTSKESQSVAQPVDNSAEALRPSPELLASLTGGSLAALPTGAHRSPPTAVPQTKRPHELSVAEVLAIVRDKRRVG
jgi:uncharacterized protein YdaU (DUF1376 family)